MKWYNEMALCPWLNDMSRLSIPRCGSWSHSWSSESMACQTNPEQEFKKSRNSNCNNNGNWNKMNKNRRKTISNKGTQTTQTTRTMFPWSMTSAITKNIEKLTRVTRCENPPQFASWLVRAPPAPKTWYMSMTSLDWDSPSQHDGSKAFLMSSLTSMYHIVYIDNKWL